jgi:hypothetical protein
MLPPLFYAEAIISFPGSRGAGEEDRSLLHGTELMEVAAKDDYRNPTEVSSRLSQSAELFVDGVQRPSAQHADFVYDQDLFLLPVHLGLPVDAESCRARRCEAVWVTGAAYSRDCVFRESASGMDSDSIDVRGRCAGRRRQ